MMKVQRTLSFQDLSKLSVSIQFFTYIHVLDDLDKSVILLLFASHGNIFLDLQTVLAYVPTAPTLSVMMSEIVTETVAEMPVKGA